MKPGKLNREEGTILLIAIIVAGMGAFGIAAWVSLLHSRLGQSEAIEAAALRRVRMENSRAAAREYMYQSVITKGSGSLASINLPNGWGGFVAEAWSGNPLAATTFGSYNHVAPSANQTNTFEKSVNISLADGLAHHGHQFKVRSAVPMTHEDLFVVHRRASNPSAPVRVRGNINVYGRAVIYPDYDSSHPEDFNDLDACRLIRPVNAVTSLSVTDPSNGNTVLPDNYPLVPMANSETGGVPGYFGGINVVDGGVSGASNSLMQLALASSPVIVDGDTFRAWDDGVACNGNGRLYIDLDNQNLGTVIISDVFRIYMYGQTNSAQASFAGTLPPALIVYTRNSSSERDLYSVRCFDENNRKLIMGIKKAAGGVETYGYFYESWQNPTWRMMLTMENTRMRTINLYGGSVNFKGGIRTDRNIRHTGWYSYAGSFNIVPEDQYAPMIQLMTRNAWLESYRS